ncbi:MAG: ATP-binding protein [Candidatus Thiodiazotropha lotti]|nr:ATP-binding protein [Candidatus Thiodiazotropha lotti]
MIWVILLIDAIKSFNSRPIIFYVHPITRLAPRPDMLNSNVNLSLLVRFLRLLLPLTLISAGFFYILYLIEFNKTIEINKIDQQSRVDVQKERLEQSFRGVIGDLRIMSTHHELLKLVDGDIGTVQDLASDYLYISSIRKVYDQIRYLDDSGQEIIRVNYNFGAPATVPTAQLQNKGDRYYFSDAFKLNKGEIFISPLDLNVERGQIERPLKPMIRVGTPIVDSQGSKTGIVLLNYLGHDMLKSFDQLTAHSQEAMMLLNAEGYWLKSPEPEEEWGFMFEERKQLRFQNRYPAEWQRIQNKEAGQFLTEAGLFTFRTIRPIREEISNHSGESPNSETAFSDYHWKLVFMISDTSLQATSNSNHKTFIILFLITTFVLGIVSAVAANAQNKKRLAEKALRKQFKKTSDALLQVEQSNQQLETAYKDLKSTQTQLLQAEKMQSIGQLAAGIAHEINTPIQYIGDNISFLEEGFNDLLNLSEKQDSTMSSLVVNPEQQQLLDAIDTLKDEVDMEMLKEEIPLAITQSEEGIDRVKKIVQAMKEFSHPGKNSMELTDLNKLIESTITVCRNEWKYNAKMVTDLDSNLPAVECIAQVISQALLNIVVNASHAIAQQNKESGQKGRITIQSRMVEKWVEIKISDNGCGIPEENLTRVFEPFFTTKDVGKGTGQGLALAYRAIVEQHKGKLEVDSQLQRGTIFTIRLPR